MLNDIKDDETKLKIISKMFAAASWLIMHQRTCNVSHDVYKVLKQFIDDVEQAGITSETIRWYQKPSKWPQHIREEVRQRAEKLFGKSKEQ